MSGTVQTDDKSWVSMLERAPCAELGWTSPGMPEPSARSPIEELLDAIETHIASEEDALSAYRWMKDASEDPVVALLMELVLEDEERHHRLLERIAASARGSLSWKELPGALPSTPARAGVITEEAIAATRSFIEDERQDARRLRALATEGRRLHDGLDTLLLETMALDSEKHKRILRYILHRLEVARSEGRPR